MFSDSSEGYVHLDGMNGLHTLEDFLHCTDPDEMIDFVGNGGIDSVLPEGISGSAYLELTGEDFWCVHMRIDNEDVRTYGRFIRELYKRFNVDHLSADGAYDESLPESVQGESLEEVLPNGYTIEQLLEKHPDTRLWIIAQVTDDDIRTDPHLIRWILQAPDFSRETNLADLESQRQRNLGNSMTVPTLRERVQKYLLRGG